MRPLEGPDPRHLWGIVLAGGDGARLRPYIRRTYGMNVPKQFMAFTGSRSMLQHTLQRAERLISPERILTVVSSRHGDEVERQLGDRPSGTVIVQPENRETAAGVLLPLMHILARDPKAVVAVLPSDHFVLEEERFMEHVRAAAKASAAMTDKIVLLGVTPDAPESEYGWIQQGDMILEAGGMTLRGVRRFVEKPPPKRAAALLQQCCLWNSLVFTARADALLRLIRSCLPEMVERFDRIRRRVGKPGYRSVVKSEYRNMRPADISRAVFEKSPPNVAVMPLRGVLWSDWGSPRRIEGVLDRIKMRPAWVNSWYSPSWTFHRTRVGEVRCAMLRRRAVPCPG